MAIIINNDAEIFLRSPGNKTIYFSRAAAETIFKQAASWGVEMRSYEAGIGASGKFEARLDGIWSRFRGHTGEEFLEEGNLRGLKALRNEPDNYNVFVVSGKK